MDPVEKSFDHLAGSELALGYQPAEMCRSKRCDFSHETNLSARPYPD